MKTSSLILIALATALPGTAPLLAVESREERIARIASLTSVEKEELAQKKKRFDELSPEERERIRKLQAEIDSRADQAELLATMQHYHEWLKTLSTNQRTTLLGMNDDERVKYVKELVAQQQQKAWRKLAEQASPEDLDTVFAWLQEFVEKHRDDLLPRDAGRRLAAMDKDRQALVLIYVMFARFPRPPRPDKPEVEDLLQRLSPEAQKFFNETSDFPRRMQLIAIWSRAAWWSKAFPNVTSQQLAAFFERLPPEERDRLEFMQPIERDSELRLHYARANFLRRGELGDRPWETRGPGRPGGPPPHDRPPSPKAGNPQD
jgi:hypothetical protein